MLDQADIDKLKGGGDCLLHYHESDRQMTQASLHQLSSVQKIRSVVAGGNVLYSDDIVLADTTSASFSLQLPLSKGGGIFEIIKIAAPNSLTITPTGADKLCGDTSVLVTLQWTALRFKAISGGYALA